MSLVFTCDDCGRTRSVDEVEKLEICSDCDDEVERAGVDLNLQLNSATARALEAERERDAAIKDALDLVAEGNRRINECAELGLAEARATVQVEMGALRAERDAARADAAALREALHECRSVCYEHHVGGPEQSPGEPCRRPGCTVDFWQRVEAALASSPGSPLLARLKTLEETLSEIANGEAGLFDVCVWCMGPPGGHELKCPAAIASAALAHEEAP